ncbi:DUF7268 family protein [Halocatena halophila]|uniref:DUF7268 family protein n=1 Tax=Halocatena halophila TaxID=2814576 RepID=UPI002ED4E0B0
MAATNWLETRVRIVGGSLLAGVAIGALGLLVGGVRYDSQTVTTQLFAVGALVFGFGLLGWSGSVLLGRSIETVHRHLDRESDWTEASSRRAMARVAGFGGGIMGAVTVVGLLFGP